MDQNSAFLWTIGYNINPQQVKRNQKSMQNLYKIITSSNNDLFNDFRPYGYVFLSNQITKKEIVKYFDSKIIQMFQWESWMIKIGDEVDIKKWETIFSFIKQAQIKLLQIRGLPMPSILKSVSHVGLYELTHLNLYSCGIVSIQPLTFIDAPNLKILNLIYNYVSEYKCLKKINFKLDKLFIYSRKESEIGKEMSYVRIDHSSRWDFQLGCLRLEKNIYNEIIMEDLSFLSKLKLGQYVSFNISMFKRINQKKLFKKYFDQQKIRLYLSQIRDIRQFPQQAIYDDNFFDSFRFQAQ